MHTCIRIEYIALFARSIVCRLARIARKLFREIDWFSLGLRTELVSWCIVLKFYCPSFLPFFTVTVTDLHLFSRHSDENEGEQVLKYFFMLTIVLLFHQIVPVRSTGMTVERTTWEKSESLKFASIFISCPFDLVISRFWFTNEKSQFEIHTGGVEVVRTLTCFSTGPNSIQIQVPVRVNLRLKKYRNRRNCLQKRNKRKLDRRGKK